MKPVALEVFLATLYTDADTRNRFLASPEATAREAGLAVLLLIKSGSDECDEHGDQNDDLFHGWCGTGVKVWGCIKRRR